MTEKNTTPKSALDPEVLEMSSKITQNIAYNKKTKEGEEQNHVYEAVLPPSLTMETVNAVAKQNATFIAAGTHAWGNMAIEAMRADGDLNETSLQLKMAGKDTLSISVQRSKEYNNSLAKEGDPKTVTKFGVVTATYDVVAAANRGQLKAVRNELAALAAEHLSK